MKIIKLHQSGMLGLGTSSPDGVVLVNLDQVRAISSIRIREHDETRTCSDIMLGSDETSVTVDETWEDILSMIEAGEYDEVPIRRFGNI